MNLIPTTRFFCSFTVFLITLHNVLSNFDGYPFQILEDSFHSNVLCGAMVVVQGGRGNDYVGRWRKGEASDRVGQGLARGVQWVPTHDIISSQYLSCWLPSTKSTRIPYSKLIVSVWVCVWKTIRVHCAELALLRLKQYCWRS